MMAQKSLLATVFTWKYGNIDIPASQIFLLRKNVVGLVNLKPTVAGHVIVCPRRNVTRLRDLNEIETVDLWLSATEVHKVIEDLYKCTCAIVVQDGAEAGQSVPHSHIHIIPQTKEGLLTIHDADQREVRSETDMAEEATRLRDHFEQSTYIQ